MKYSFKSLWRQPTKTLLFFFLLILCSVFLVLAISMRTSSMRMISDAKKEFLTLAEVEYNGDSPYSAGDRDYTDKMKDYDYSELLSLDNIDGFEPYYQLRGYFGEYTADSDYKKTAVIMFKVLEEAKGKYSCMLLKNYYNMGRYPEGLKFTLNTADFELNKDGKSIKPVHINHIYLAVGEFDSYIFDLSSTTFTPCRYVDNQTENSEYISKCEGLSVDGFYVHESEADNLDYYSIYEMYSKVKNTKKPYNYGPFIDVTNCQDYFSSKFYDEEWVKAQNWSDEKFLSSLDWTNVLYAVSRSYEVINYSTDVCVTSNLEHIPLFHQNLTLIKGGRLYNESDGDSVCMISSRTAYAKELEVGDKLTVSLHNSDLGSNYYNSYFFGTGFIDIKEYTVIGIYDLNDGIDDIVYIPYNTVLQPGKDIRKASDLPFRTGLTYKLGTFFVDNSAATYFAEYAKSVLPDKYSVTVYDQGYIMLISPLESLKDTALLIAGISILVGLSIIVLYAYIFISKQQQTATTMLNLGAGNRRTRSYLMTSSCALALVACVIGAVVGYAFSDLVLEAVYIATANNSIFDLRYSTLRTSAAEKMFELNFKADIVSVIVTCAAVFVVCAVICLLFSNAVIAKDRSNIVARNSRKRGKTNQ